MRDNSKLNLFVVLVALYTVTFFMSSLVVHRMIAIGAYIFTASTLLSFIHFTLIDVIHEFFGSKKALFARNVGILIRLSMFVAILGVISLPVPESLKDLSRINAFNLVMGGAMLAVVAGSVSQFIGQGINIRLRKLIAIVLKGKHLEVRTSASTFVGMIISSSIFHIIVFYNSGLSMANILGTNFALRLLFVFIIQTPLVSIITHSLRKFGYTSLIDSKGDEESLML